MRSVWDMFQLCARLLPNYIVAIRPFEDRSTIFYGKPHWLYTSGVVPVSTGFPSEEQALKDGTVTPIPIRPDSELMVLLDKINKETSPLGDSAAALALQESSLSETLSNYSKSMTTFSGIFKPGSSTFLGGKVIDLNDNARLQYYEDNKIVSKIPVNEGLTQVGFHLPFGKPGIYSEIQSDHKQIESLPLRYRYPFFSDRTSGTLPSLDFNRALQVSAPLEEQAANIYDMSLIEDSLINPEGSSGDTALIIKNSSGEKVLNFSFNFADKVSQLGLDAAFQISAALDPSGISAKDGSIRGVMATQTIQMPLPVLNSINKGDTVLTKTGPVLRKEYQKYYQELDPAYSDSYVSGLNFEEWGMPATAEEEQFHIAMKWPYLAGEAGSDERKAFLNSYGFLNDSLYGKPQDYKKRRVLVYNEETRQAVVCAPAYFLWGEEGEIDAIVSPDAAYFLGLLIDQSSGEINLPFDLHVYEDRLNKGGIGTTILTGGMNLITTPLVNSAINHTVGKKHNVVKNGRTKCRFTFVPDYTPLGVVTSDYNPAHDFSISLTQAVPANDNGSPKKLIGFGNFRLSTGQLNVEDTQYQAIVTPRASAYDRSANTPNGVKKGLSPNLNYSVSNLLTLRTVEEVLAYARAGGNYSDYFSDIFSGNLDELGLDNLIEKRNNDKSTFSKVFDSTDPISIEARTYYDEKYTSNVRVIGGNGRTIGEAEQIWDQFRYGYHNYGSVKAIWEKIYNMDPDSDSVSSDPLLSLLSNGSESPLKELTTAGDSREFSTLLGADWLNANGQQQRNDTVDIAIKEYLNAGFDGYDENQKVKFSQQNGIIDLFNMSIKQQIESIRSMVKQYVKIYLFQQNQIATTQDQQIQTITEEKLNEETNKKLQEIKTPKQLFLLMVGIFRQTLWTDPYSRAWLVLKPDKKRAGTYILAGTTTGAVAGSVLPGVGTAIGTGVGFGIGAVAEGLNKATSDHEDDWSFGPVDKIWQAFIDYNTTYSSSPEALKKLLQANSGEGNSSSNWFTGIKSDIDNFWDRNIGPIFTAFDTALGGLLNMFNLSLQQMGYGLSNLENFTRQANILNKAYNDSIYYSLGRKGSLLRAVDNPFTREYGEPVVEIREPFQRMHYISSFSHIISNNISENLNGVATQITAVSDGKYPVTVALDKAAPPERQVERTVETGIYFDNLKGSGITGVLHPLMHPLETFRGIAKAKSGEPDELTAKRVALAHLKESLKDIYGGEILIIGNSDIRPHDLVYIADVYERMFGLFEVEQVVHHFTPQMGFVTAITPNALVSVNDPSRWFMTSWMGAHFGLQDLRNSSRLMLVNASNNSVLTPSGEVDVDALSEALKVQLSGSVNYTHGHSALVRDIVANQAAEKIPDAKAKMDELIKLNTGKQNGAMGAAVFSALVMPTLTVGLTALAATTLGPVGVAGVFAGGALASDAIWSGWKYVRDNILDQHGCYIQYLNKNGQAMDAGLSFNQGMVVGRYATKKLLPSLLGGSVTVREANGNMYIRSDDILKNLGWKEKEIGSIVRYISLENAIVHSELLKYSGISPERTGLNESFKVIVRVTHVVDGDTFDVEDVLGSASSAESLRFRVRFDGINTSELAKQSTDLDPGTTVDDYTAIINENSPAGRALRYTESAVKGKLITLRINPRDPSKIIEVEGIYDPGSEQNNKDNYAVAFKGKDNTSSNDRYMATVFCNYSTNKQESIYNNIRSIFLNQKNSSFAADFKESTKQSVRKLFYTDSVIYTYFDKLYSTLDAMVDLVGYFKSTGTGDPLSSLSENEIRHFNVLMGICLLDQLYEKASEWPIVYWNDYYEDGTPITLNWELVVNGLAKVYMDGLRLNDQKSTQGQSPVPQLVYVPSLEVR